MKQTRIVLVCLALVLALSSVVAAQPVAAQPAVPDTAVFLASLAAPQAPAEAPALPDLGVPAPHLDACTDDFCNAFDQAACDQECYPCRGSMRCRFFNCSITCTCVC